MTAQANARRAWHHEGKSRSVPKIARVCYPVAQELGCQPKTVSHYLHEIGRIAAAIVRGYHRLGDHVAKDAFLREIKAADHGDVPPALTNSLLLDKSEIDAQENVARDAYELERSPGSRDTLIRRLRKEATLATVLADALEGEPA